MESLNNIWKPELYRIQMDAPKPKRIICDRVLRTEPPELFGKEYHGVISHKEARSFLVEEPNGAFLIRKGSENNNFYTLTWRFNDNIHHYKLYYDGRFYMKDKKYDCIYDLVADGLIMMYMELKARHILEKIHSASTNTYTESPYVTLNRKKLKSLSQKNALLLQEAAQAAKKEIETDCANDKNSNKLIQIPNFDCSPSVDDNPLISKYSKAHGFKVHTFKGLNWCEYCANFLWGFTAQGVKCEDCGFIAHSKCSERVPNHCLPDLKKIRGVFGIDLTTLLNAHSSTLPFVVRRCVNEIEARGMDSEGIYRVSGFADEIDSLKLAFDKDGEAADLSVYSNINVVAGTLKLYLRLLPVPLITYDVHSQFLRTTNVKNPEDQVGSLRECLNHLPPAHFNCLQYMIQHLHTVSLHADVNKMSAHNLSTVFAPTLVATPPAVTDLTFEIRALQALIEYCPLIYYGKM